MLCITELNTFDMNDSNYHDLLCRGTGDNLSIEGSNAAADHSSVWDTNVTLLTDSGDPLKDVERP